MMIDEESQTIISDEVVMFFFFDGTAYAYSHKFAVISHFPLI